MKRSILVLILTFVFVFATPSVQSQSSNFIGTGNGAEWKSTPETAKLEYIRGVLESRIRDEIDVMRVLRAVEDGIKLKYKSDAATTALLLNQAQLDKTMVDITLSLGNTRKVTFGEVLAGVNTFYDSSENLPVCMHHAVIIEAKSFSGNSAAPSELESIRQGDGREGCQM